MKNRSMPIVCFALPVAVALAALMAAKSFYDKVSRLDAENAACVAAIESLSPFMKGVCEYRAAERYLDANAADAVLPDLPMGMPAAKRESRREPADRNGWTSVREVYVWDEMLPGQAFAALAAFSAPSVTQWRIGALDMSCVGNDDKASLSVTLERAVRPQE